MNQFNKKLDQARSRQKRFFFLASMAVLIILLLVAALFVVSRGTRIEIMPQEVKDLTEIKVVQGYGFYAAGTVYSFAGNLSVTAITPGFKIALRTIKPPDLGNVFYVKLVELPGHLLVQLSGDSRELSKTAWRINGRDIAPADRLDLQLEPGHYNISIDNPFFQEKEIEVEIKRDEQLKLKVALQPVSGMLNITSKPAGAAVFLADERVGSTPLKLRLEGGRYSLRLAAENYIDTLEQLTITRTNAQIKRNYRLQLKKAELSLKLAPEGGLVLVNGARGVSPLILDATVEHRLSYMKKGYYTASKTVRLKAGERRQLSFQLKPEMGRVEISSRPPATVYIDGREYGLSPVSLDLPAVRQKVTLKKEGYRTVAKEVEPRGGAVKKISVTLLTEYQARLQEAPVEYTNAAGIKLKLYLVNDSLVLGAPRSEKGQRANEFLRKTRLTKPFYASIFEISNGQFAKSGLKKTAGVANSPATSVSWQEAAAFCNWLSRKEKLSPFYKIAVGRVTGFAPRADGYRLLSEAEWEWLARKSGKKEQTIFSWGNDTVIPARAANIADESSKGQTKFYVPGYNDGYAATAPVGSLAREISGLYDMAGNVSEWVHDVYSIAPPRPGTIASNPLGQQDGRAHVVKGANWRSGTITTLRPAFRQGLTGRRDDVGFRIGRYLYGGEDG